jgi:serine acetyltransferase
MFEHIRADMKYTFERRKIFSSTDALKFLVWGGQGLQAIIIYRFGRWLGSIRKHPFGGVIAILLYPAYWMLSACIRTIYDINLEQSADIASGFCITHFGGIEVRNCRIGSHCYIYQNVKLGTKEATGRGLVINDGVYISPHAQICADVDSLHKRLTVSTS